MKTKTNKAFTLIELLIVIGIIGILASVVLVNLSEAKEKARDAERKQDLNSISRALESHYSSNGTYVVAGTGSGGSGNGWFSYQGGAYVTSVAQGLVNLGHFPTPIVDPSGNTANYSDSGGAYMIRATTTSYTVWTSLENPTAADTDTMNSCALSDYDGYHSSYPVERRMNYCVSSRN